MTKVAACYGVSSNFLARICERLNVPHPSRGYWQQLEVGKAEPKATLPEPRPGEELEWARGDEPRRFFQPTSQQTIPQEPAPKRRFPPGTIHPLLIGQRLARMPAAVGCRPGGATILSCTLFYRASPAAPQFASPR